jgi:hypothetical protein
MAVGSETFYIRVSYVLHDSVALSIKFPFVHFAGTRMDYNVSHYYTIT